MCIESRESSLASAVRTASKTPPQAVSMVRCDLEHFELEQRTIWTSDKSVPRGIVAYGLARSVSLLPGADTGNKYTGNKDTGKLERAKGFEPSTPTLARSCSTPELHPHPKQAADRRPPKGRAMPNAAYECNSQI